MIQLQWWCCFSPGRSVRLCFLQNSVLKLIITHPAHKTHYLLWIDFMWLSSLRSIEVTQLHCWHAKFLIFRLMALLWFFKPSLEENLESHSLQIRHTLRFCFSLFGSIGWSWLSLLKIFSILIWHCLLWSFNFVPFFSVKLQI